VLLGAAMTIPPQARKALDIGTGTGVIALMVAQRSKDCIIRAIDIDPESAKEAQWNFENSPWSSRLSAQCVDLLQYESGQPFDLIFSNPPYFENSLKNPSARESAARHTSELSYREICAFAARCLSPQGTLSMILPAAEETSLIRTAASWGLKPFRIISVKTTAKKSVSRIVAEFAFDSQGRGLRREELVLQNGPDRTPEYQKLCEAFYL